MMKRLRVEEPQSGEQGQPIRNLPLTSLVYPHTVPTHKLAQPQRKRRLQGDRKRVKLSVFRTYHASHCQDLADITGQSVDLYRGIDGLPRVVLAEWPCAGEYVGRFLTTDVHVQGDLR